MSQGLCSISKTMPSYFAVVMAQRGLDLGAGEGGEGGLPCSSARMTPFRRGVPAFGLLMCSGLRRIVGSTPCVTEEARRVTASCPWFDSPGFVHSIAASPRREGGVMIIDCHGHYTTAPKELQDWRKQPDRRARGPERTMPPRPLKISDDEIRESIEGGAAQAPARARHRPDDLLAARRRHVASHRRRRDEPRNGRAHCNDLIHRVCTLYPENFVGVCQLPQSPGVAPSELHRRARALRQRARLRRLQPQSRSVGRLLERAAAHRPLVVSALREDGRARRAGDDPCQRLVQSELPRHRRALHQRRHHRLHAVHHLGPVQGFPDAANSSSRMAAARCPITGAAIAAWRRT